MSPVATDWAGQAARLCLCGIRPRGFPCPSRPVSDHCGSALPFGRTFVGRTVLCPVPVSVHRFSVGPLSLLPVGPSPPRLCRSAGRFCVLPVRLGSRQRSVRTSPTAAVRRCHQAVAYFPACLSPTAETATTVRWFSDRSPDWQGPTWNLRCRADCHRRATRRVDFSPCLGVRPTGDSTHRSLCLGLSTSLLSCLSPDRPVRSDRCRGLGVCPRGMFAQHRHQSRISRSDSLSSDPRVLPTVTFS